MTSLVPARLVSSVSTRAWPPVDRHYIAGVHIGLILGIGPAATDYYYCSLIARMASAGNDLELTMVSPVQGRVFASAR